MEHRDSAGFYVVDALPLTQPSARPRHLELRMRGRQSPPTTSPPSSSPTLRPAHVNRAAILEARREKLSSKLSHIRDAVTSARARQTRDCTRKRNSLNRGLKAAERNRARILQDQVRACQEVNERALEVAREQRRLAEERKMARRIALEERLRAHAERRQKFLAMPKRAFLQDVNRQHEAASTIQKWLRAAVLASLLRPLSAEGGIGLSLERVREMPFQKTMLMLQDKELIARTARLVAYINKAAGKSVQIRANSANLARVFLSSYFMVAHTHEIFPQITPREEALLDSANKMLAMFADLQSTFDVTPEPSPNSSLSSSMCDAVHESITAFHRTFKLYHSTFVAWKQNDTSAMVTGMIEHYLQLEKILNLVGPAQNAREEFEPKVRAQQAEVRAQLARIAGKDGLERLEEAVVEYQRGLQTTEEEDHMSVDESGKSDASAVRKAKARSRRASQKEQGSPTRPSASISDETVSRGSSDLQRVLSSLGSSLSNLELAHELVMDPEFTISTERILGPQHMRIQKIARKAFFDGIRKQIEARDLEWMPNLLSEVRKGLLALIPNPASSKVAYLIKETLDGDFLVQQLEKGVLDPHKLIAFVLDVMSQLCAPARDQTVRDLRALEDMAEQIHGIMDLLEDMKLDLANYHLGTLKPFLKTHAREYETNKFDAAERDGSLTLENTKAWLKRGYGHLKSSEPGMEKRSDLVVIESYLELLFASHTHDLEPGRAPETLNLDARRLFALQNRVQGATIIAALLMLTRGFSAEHRKSDVAMQKLASELKVLLDDAEDVGMDNLIVQVTNAIGTDMPETQRETVANMVRKTLSYEDPVYRNLRDKLRAALRAILRGEGQTVNWTKAGLEYVKSEVEKVGQALGVLVQFNTSVHAKRYARLVKEVQEVEGKN